MVASEDGLTYDFVLRKGVKFHNGDPVTAEDVKFSFERYRGTSHDLMKNRVAAIETPDPRHVRFKLKEPWPDFLTFYASATGAGWIVPKKYVEKVGDDGFKKAPIGAGPYKFVSFTPGVELVLEAFEGYWRKTPSVKRLVFKVDSRRGDAAGGAEARRGRHRLLDPRRARRGAAAHAGAHAQAAVIPGPYWLYFPDQWDPKSPWHDVRVRQAANLAIDRKGINQALTLGYSQAHRQQHHPRELRVLLAAAATGLRSGQGEAAAGRGRIPQRLRRRRILLRRVLLERRRGDGQQLREVGIRARLRPLERAAFFKAYGDKKLQEHHLERQRRLRQRRDAAGGLRRQGRHLRLRQLPRHRRAVPAAGRRARPQEARGDPAQDAAARARAGDVRADLAAGLHQRRRAARRRVRFRADPGYAYTAPYEDITIKG